jgi:hypothetical protein
MVNTSLQFDIRTSKNTWTRCSKRIWTSYVSLVTAKINLQSCITKRCKVSNTQNVFEIPRVLIDYKLLSFASNLMLECCIKQDTLSVSLGLIPVLPLFLPYYMACFLKTYLPILKHLHKTLCQPRWRSQKTLLFLSKINHDNFRYQCFYIWYFVYFPSRQFDKSSLSSQPED